MLTSHFDAPIPGQSLTTPPSGSVVEHPPAFTDLDKALNHVWDKLHMPKHLVKLIGFLKAGAPVESLTRTVLYTGLLGGLWTVDLALLMFQTVFWQIEAIAKLKGIKAVQWNPDPDHQKSLMAIGNLIDSKDQTDQIQKSLQSPPTPSATDLQQSPGNFKGFF